MVKVWQKIIFLAMNFSCTQWVLPTSKFMLLSLNIKFSKNIIHRPFRSWWFDFDPFVNIISPFILREMIHFDPFVVRCYRVRKKTIKLSLRIEALQLRWHQWKILRTFLENISKSVPQIKGMKTIDTREKRENPMISRTCQPRQNGHTLMLRYID